MFFFFKQKTAYEMRISDWSSDVCSSDLASVLPAPPDRAAAVLCHTDRWWYATTAADLRACSLAAGFQRCAVRCGTGRRTPPAASWSTTAPAAPHESARARSLFPVVAAVFGIHLDALLDLTRAIPASVHPIQDTFESRAL